MIGIIPQNLPPRNALPDAEVTKGKNNIRAVWLAGPTQRYDHGVLGDAIEAGSVEVKDDQNKRHTLNLPGNAVFEDRFARLEDLDGDGSDEIIVVKSDLNKGAALAVLILNAHGLEIAAETPPIGRANRWLNPAGIADYDGDKRNDIAIVVTPHIGGILEFWEYRGRKLHRKYQLNGFSNHAIGSRAQRQRRGNRTQRAGPTVSGPPNPGQTHATTGDRGVAVAPQRRPDARGLAVHHRRCENQAPPALPNDSTLTVH